MTGTPFRTEPLSWFKSTYSSDAGGDCIEVAYDWHKSSYSSNAGGNCVEVAAHPAKVHVRDSKVPASPVLDVTPAAWAAFVHSATTGPVA
ncbi:DUF397 domain-containing protein [Streptomyces albidoflavus]|jgi:hypothetical protein|uniref:DUF397 domain-containing protein n=3 Tax=Streptomyces TaxID=1883 RepID=D6B8U7_9ACTN|nr:MULTISPECIES: DUF397 domain-containing protein [Streptomyces]MYX49611.1 DUF397 domain-containing protein [Streptomyces sp. SID8385]QLA56357.1 DUF397 domain-containing protein [Streptomyces violascens]SCE17063.1 protein of unknown function [Streptomyces sp. IgraMP-1]BDH50317.1 toxin [Streptomyces albus]AGI87684.1 Hypothetical protein XNR_1295 [Streptomyces albidoflavus]